MVNENLGLLLESLSTLLKHTSISSEGGALVLQRSSVDLGWLAGKLKNKEYVSHLSQHTRHQLEASLRDVRKASENLEASLIL